MKFFFVLQILTIFVYTEAVTVNCQFSTGGGWILGDVHQCYVTQSLNILTKEAAIIESVTPMPSQDVKGFFVGSAMHYFPRNLDKVFPKLEKIWIHNCHLKEITQTDLRPFPILTVIYLENNDLEVLEEDLFKFNTNLEAIALQNNKITHIGQTVFDSFHKLKYLKLIGNNCINKNVENDIAGVKSLINEIKPKCIDPQYSAIDSDLRTLEDPIFRSTSDKFMEKFNQLKNKLASSNLHSSSVSSFNKRLTAVLELWTQKKNQENLVVEFKKTQIDLETEVKSVSTKVEANIKLTQAMQTDLTARISALEAMTQKILDIVGNLTVVDDVHMTNKCDGEWND